MSRVVIFGNRDFASLAHFYLTHDSPHEVVAFTVEGEFMQGETHFEGMPLTPLEELDERFPPDEFAAFAPLSHRQMNGVRERIYGVLKQRGYELISYISSRATRFPNTPIGDNCFILEDNTIQPFVRIGSNVVLWSGNHIGHHSVIEDHVFFTSHVVLSGHCHVGPRCFLGVNATIRDQLRLGEGTLVGMGACVTRDTEPWSVYKGTPARPSQVSSRDLEF
ncbi:MAG: acetyltransferase [Planctomycetales bacterium]|nr:acetyltransferase [Planctomycetales bacterium]